MEQKKTLGSIIKWIIILALLAFGFISNREFMHDAFLEIKNTPNVKLILIFIVANLYFMAEGTIIHLMTGENEKALTIFQGISCSYMCAFYRLATLGSGNGIAQVYYYKTKGIDVSKGTGMSIVQYTFQKITIGIMGILSFLILIAFGNSNLLKYSWFMIAGVLVISIICIVLFLLTVSKKISVFVIALIRTIIKKESRLTPKIDKLDHAVNSLQTEGRIIWHDKKVFLIVVLLDILKFCCWYIIPGILFVDTFDLNPLMCMALMAVCNMLGCVMVAPSGIGTLDFVFALFFGTIVKNGKAIAAAIIIYRFFTWAVPFMIGLIPAAFLNKTNKKETDTTE
ncbi:MAG: flippase-like domain-containing protein [Lachnospiraceae bacterium]|nr:flippase-like domain-containing protein [Lachnospiraceae bacterium]